MHRIWITASIMLISSTTSPPHGGVSKIGNAPVEMHASIEDLSKAASMGDALAASKLVDYFLYEKHDEEKWKYWALIAAENGDASSQFLEYSILSGSKDPAQQRRAFYWLKKSAHSGFDGASAIIKDCFPSGNFEPHAKDCLGGSEL